MVCEGQVYEEPVLIDPVLIGGLPGIGFVANIASLHLVRELKAKLFTEIRSSFFQDIAVTSGKGKANFPVNKLYYHKGRDDERDLIILSGNTQALTTNGQYELCEYILDLTTPLGCKYVITLGGLLLLEFRLEDKSLEPPLVHLIRLEARQHQRFVPPFFLRQVSSRLLVFPYTN